MDERTDQEKHSFKESLRRFVATKIRPQISLTFSDHLHGPVEVDPGH